MTAHEKKKRYKAAIRARILDQQMNTAKGEWQKMDHGKSSHRNSYYGVAK
jgi:hypothetical protein